MELTPREKDKLLLFTAGLLDSNLIILKQSRIYRLPFWKARAMAATSRT